MKRGTPDHPKLMLLAAELGVPLYAAGGLLEFLWSWSSRYAIQGDIGRWPDAMIAQGVRWDGAPEKLIEALKTACWIDEAPAPYRLVIHDVCDHADNSWRQCLEDAGLTWWDGKPARKPKGGYKTVSSKTPEKLQTDSNKTPQPSLSFPLKEPEPSLPRARVESGKSRGLAAEDGFTEFRQLCGEVGITGSDPDWDEAAGVWRNRLDFEQRLAAMKGLRDRAGTDDPGLKSLPQNYLGRKMWQRVIRAPTTGGGGPRPSKGELAVMKIYQREQEKSC